MKFDSFIGKQGVVHKVGDQEVEFFEISVKTLFKIKSIAQPLSESIAAFTSGGNDTAQSFREYGEPARDPKTGNIVFLDDKAKVVIRDKESIVESITPELAAFRSEQRSKAINGIIDLFTQPATQGLLSDMIQSSLRVEKPLPADEFFNNVSPAALIELLTGVFKANKSVFSPFEKMLTPVVARVKGSLANNEKATSSGENYKINASASPAGSDVPSNE